MSQTDETPDMSHSELSDRLAASDAVYSYATNIDSGNFQGLERTLHKECRARFGNMEWVVGRDAVLDQIHRGTAGMAWQHHFLNIYSLVIEGDSALALVYHTSHQASVDEPDVAGLLVGRYQMLLARSDSGWQLTEVNLEFLWAQRLTDDAGYLASFGGRGPLLAAFATPPA